MTQDRTTPARLRGQMASLASGHAALYYPYDMEAQDITDLVEWLRFVAATLEAIERRKHAAEVPHV